MGSVAFHFHGYQPGDVVRWVEPDPLKRPTFEERRSPVSHTIGSDRVTGRNWTDAVLRTYGRLQSVLDRSGGAASVDIEPHTLAWLLERDPDAYRKILTAYARGTAGLVLTPPFHPIMPHHHALEREILFEMMIDFYKPLLRRPHAGPIGLWLPEAAYSRETLASFMEAARRVALDDDAVDLVRDTYLILDERQIGRPTHLKSAWATLEVDGGAPLIARDVGLSAEFAFGGSSATEFCAAARGRAAQTLLVASDLESLLANPAQTARFGAIVDDLRAAGVDVSGPSPPAERMTAEVVDFSSWSDYDEYVYRGHTSDTRWTGLRRIDGLVVSRDHLGERLSQLWKHAFGLATERVETAVRRTARNLLRDLEVKRPAEALRRLAIAYGRHLFEDHYRSNGASSDDVDFAKAAERILKGDVDVETAAHLARGYILMLMGLRSDPRFWDNPDTRVTFQNVAFLAQALVDTAEACSRARDPTRADRLHRLLRSTLLEFSELYVRGEFTALQGVDGWETTEAAWHQALQSEAPRRSHLDVVQRATLFAVGQALPERLRDVPHADEGVVADTGHIVGEGHGDWANREWCEHRTG